MLLATKDFGILGTMALDHIPSIAIVVAAAWASTNFVKNHFRQFSFAFQVYRMVGLMI